MSKRLIIIRHAHRDNTDHAKDNGLSDKGHDQVKKLVKFVEKQLEGTIPQFFSSPKKRCMETLAPIAKAFGAKVDIDERLVEHGPAETSANYHARIDEFLDFFKHECADVTVICSHGDWIPVAVHQLTNAKVGLKKAGYIEMEYAQGECFLTWIVQKV